MQPVLDDGIYDFVSIPWKPALLSHGVCPTKIEFFEGGGGEGLEISTTSPARWQTDSHSSIHSLPTQIDSETNDVHGALV